MIKLNNVKSYFNSTIDLNNDSVLEIWNKFKSFCLVDVENEDDREILFETGVEKIEGIKYFYVNFVRQFTIYDGDEYDGMEQLICAFHFEHTKEFRFLKKSEWSMDYEDLETYFKEIEKTKAFQKMIDKNPVKRTLMQEEI